jgi:hypothetical protein
MPLISSDSKAEPTLTQILKLTASTGICSAKTLNPLGKIRSSGWANWGLCPSLGIFRVGGTAIMIINGLY